MATLTREASRVVNEALGLPAAGAVTFDVLRAPPGGPHDGDRAMRLTTAGGDVVVWLPMVLWTDSGVDLWALVAARLRAGRVTEEEPPYPERTSTV